VHGILHLLGFDHELGQQVCSISNIQVKHIYNNKSGSKFLCDVWRPVELVQKP